MTFAAFKRIVAVVAIVCAVFAASIPVHAQPPTPAQEGFVPIDQLPPDDRLPAAPLLIAAYVLAWILLLGYLWSIWQRLSKVERELAEVGRRIEAGARR